MKGLIKTIIILSIIFSSTFILARIFNIVNFDIIKGWLIELQGFNTLLVALIIVILLTVDIIITVPTLALTTLSGYILGFQEGLLVSATGMYFAGILGYTVSIKYGNRFLNFVIRSPDERSEMEELFSQRGYLIIILSRAVPMLPEISACLAGVSNISFNRFLIYWSIATLPYAAIASYAGSIGSVEAPQKTIIILMALITSLWGLGLFLRGSLKPSRD